MGNIGKELPGFYFDADKNRYFPVSSKRSKTCQDKNLCQGSKQVNSVTQIGVLRILESREIGCQFTNRSSSSVSSNFQRQYVETQTSHPRVWKYGSRILADGALERLYARIQTEEGLNDLNVLTWGGTNGWLWISEIAATHTYLNAKPLYMAEQLFRRAGSSNQKEIPFNLQESGNVHISSSKITAIKRFGETSDANPELCYAALISSLGSAAEGGALHILWKDPNGVFVPFEVSKCVSARCSVWTATWCGAAKASLGTSKGAALVDIERASLRWAFRSRSDVLSQQCDSTGNILLCGLRNGHISVVDLRMPSSTATHASVYQNRDSPFPTTSRKPPAYASASNLRFPQSEALSKNKIQDRSGNHLKAMKMASAICSMALLHTDENYVLASAMNGIIQLWDRRLVGKGAVQFYEGHCNSHTMLQLGVDPTETLLASGGEDCSIRIWNVRSGKRLCTMSSFAYPANTICWPRLQRSTSFSKHNCVDFLPEQNHSWGMWLGSRSELLYAHGAAS